jgi:hypothetical protein
MITGVSAGAGLLRNARLSDLSGRSLDLGCLIWPASGVSTLTLLSRGVAHVIDRGPGLVLFYWMAKRSLSNLRLKPPLPGTGATRARISSFCQPMPLPASTCMPYSCYVSPPQFYGRTSFLAINHGRAATYLLVTHDTGATWHAVALPDTAERIGSARFFSPRHGLLITAISQQAPGPVFHRTCRPHLDAGRQGIRFQPGMTVSFVSPDAGFAGNPETSGAPPVYATMDGGPGPGSSRGSREPSARPPLRSLPAPRTHPGPANRYRCT